MGRAGVYMYKATDGRIFEDKKRYQEHQAFLDLVELCDDEDLGVDSATMARWLCAHRDEVMKLLRKAQAHTERDDELDGEE